MHAHLQEEHNALQRLVADRVEALENGREEVLFCAFV
jgi:hypothetical protein